MLHHVRNRLTSAHAISLLALFVALGGLGYAATILPANSVGSRQLRKAAVTGPKIAKNAVRSFQVKDGSLNARDFAPGQLKAGVPGAKGDTGAPGAKGDIGPQGP